MVADCGSCIAVSSFRPPAPSAKAMAFRFVKAIIGIYCLLHLTLLDCSRARHYPAYAVGGLAMTAGVVHETHATLRAKFRYFSLQNNPR